MVLPPGPAVVLDLDGVMLQTNFIKHAAMLSLFDVDSATRERISASILANGGVRRDLKIAHILGHVLAHPRPQEELPHYLDRYSSALEQQLADAPLVPGVREFIEGGAHDFFLCSSAPDAEVRQQLRSRGLLSRFVQAFGASVPKAAALSQIRALAPANRPVFFGDSVGDLEAAQAAGVAFIAVTCERDNFEGVPVAKLREFTSAAEIQRCIVSVA